MLRFALPRESARTPRTAVRRPVTSVSFLSLIGHLFWLSGLWAGVLLSWGPHFVSALWALLMLPAGLAIGRTLFRPPAASDRRLRIFWGVIVTGVAVYLATPNYHVPDAVWDQWTNGPLGTLQGSSPHLSPTLYVVLAGYTLYTCTACGTLLVLGWLEDTRRGRSGAA